MAIIVVDPLSPSRFWKRHWCFICWEVGELALYKQAFYCVIHCNLGFRETEGDYFNPDFFTRLLQKERKSSTVYTSCHAKMSQQTCTSHQMFWMIKHD